VRGLGHPVTARGAYKLYAGSAETDARVRFYGVSELTSPGGAFARIGLSEPLVLDVGDRFVLRETGRRETVAGGVVLDTEPPPRPGAAPQRRLQAREGASRQELPALLVAERGAVRTADVTVLTGLAPGEIEGAVRAGAWWVSHGVHRGVATALRGALHRFHAEHPLLEGAELALARAAATDALGRAHLAPDPGLVEAILDDLAGRRDIARAGSTVRLASHRPSLAGHEEEVERLVRSVSDGEPTPPAVDDLVAAGFSREVIDAACREGELVRVSPDLVMTPRFVARAELIVREAGAGGVTVSAFRERLSTSRKYALPLLEHLDQRGITRRRGDVRVVRDPS
jgi:selenocysteine-specific elongation factor